MGLLVLSVCGMLVGLLAWGSVRKATRMGMATSVALGTAGAFIGAFLTCAAANSAISEMHLTGALGGALGAVVLLSLTLRAIPHRAVL